MTKPFLFLKWWGSMDKSKSSKHKQCLFEETLGYFAVVAKITSEQHFAELKFLLKAMLHYP
jgi:hypothetical protein